MINIPNPISPNISNQGVVPIINTNPISLINKVSRVWPTNNNPIFDGCGFFFIPLRCRQIMRCRLDWLYFSFSWFLNTLQLLGRLLGIIGCGSLVTFWGKPLTHVLTTGCDSWPSTECSQQKSKQQSKQKNDKPQRGQQKNMLHPRCNTSPVFKKRLRPGIMALEEHARLACLSSRGVWRRETNMVKGIQVAIRSSRLIGRLYGSVYKIRPILP